MIELYLSKNNNHFSEAYGKYYPRVSYKETLDIHLMAKHMSEHNTPFSEGTFAYGGRDATTMANFRLVVTKRTYLSLLLRAKSWKKVAMD